MHDWNRRTIEEAPLLILIGIVTCSPIQMSPSRSGTRPTRPPLFP
jgi:hypothetical protein